MKRQRGRGRGGKPGGGHHHNNHYNQNPNRSMESSGPEGAKVRGPAALVYERYLQLARDAASSGDRVLSENFLQHADHYFRMWRATQPAMPVQQQPQADRFGSEIEHEGDEDGAGEGEAFEGSDEEQPEGEFAAPPQPRQDQQARPDQQGGGQQGERAFNRDGDRRRGRRSRFRPEGGEGSPVEAGGEPRGERAERPPREPREPREGGEQRAERREREPRENRDQQGPEGFSSGPKPAFLRSE